MKAFVEQHKETLEIIAALLVIAALIIRFAYWQIHPSLLSASIFWATFITGFVLYIIAEKIIFRRVTRIIILSGSILNATVIFANDGFMPTVGNTTYSIWVASNSTAHQLLNLSDKYAGFSIGDFFIIGGILILLLHWLALKLKR